MSTRGWWIGVVTITLAILAHAAFPRYDWRPLPQMPGAMMRIDRWTGRAEQGLFRADAGRWVSALELQQMHQLQTAPPKAPEPRPAAKDASSPQVDALLAEIDKAIGDGRFVEPIVDEKLPFDPKENATNEYFRALVVDYAHTRARLTALEGRLATLEQKR